MTIRLRRSAGFTRPSFPSVDAKRKWLLYQLSHRNATDGRRGELGCLQKDSDSLREKLVPAAKDPEGTVADATRRLHHVLHKHVAFDVLLQQWQRVARVRATGARLSRVVHLEFRVPSTPTNEVRVRERYQTTGRSRSLDGSRGILSRCTPQLNGCQLQRHVSWQVAISNDGA